MQRLLRIPNEVTDWRTFVAPTLAIALTYAVASLSWRFFLKKQCCAPAIGTDIESTSVSWGALLLAEHAIRGWILWLMRAGGVLAKNTGLGGAFMRAEDPRALNAQYEKHFGIASADGGFSFPRETQRAIIAVACLPHASDYFPISQPTTLNFQVDDLDAVLEIRSAVGVPVDPKREDYDYGRFSWFTDPEGNPERNKVELWQPPD